jgi:DNA mismatch endonuclease (patch repair protein)
MSCLRSRAPAATSAAVRRVMQVNTRCETEPEQTVRRFLHRAGLRFRKDLRPLPARRCEADLVFTHPKLCIFIDGCFWHGCRAHFRIPATNADWWAEKIRANRKRDRRNDAALKRAGWQVIRLWEHQITPAVLNELASTISKSLTDVRRTLRRACHPHPRANEQGKRSEATLK